jgi:hypothetical protein
MLERMEINDVLDLQDFVAVNRKFAGIQTIKEAFGEVQSLYGEKYAASDIVIVDYSRKKRTPGSIPEDMLFVEYQGFANSRVYDLILEIISGDYNDPGLTDLGIKRKTKDALWFVLPKMMKIDTKQLKVEFAVYHTILIQA